MLIIDTTEALARALDQPLDPDLRSLLTTRCHQLGDIADAARFTITQPGDDIADIEASLGFSIMANLIDGSRYPDPEFMPSWEYVHWHAGKWVEMTFILSDDGPAEVLFVHDGEGVSAELIALLQDHAAPDADREATETA